ncbi:MAG TPA: cytochrome c oxidase subunit 3 [Gemmatimonadaceae bacterium]|nr:cytochrome c oxidase subunit 3 [Gemmatimonadaceae bacterium]
MATTIVQPGGTPPAITLPVNGRPHHTAGWWGMVLLICTEAALFVFLLFSYFYLDAQNTTWPPPGPPDITLAVINTILLVVSSVPARLGMKSIRRDSRGGLSVCIIVTMLMGIAFLIIEAIEWSQKTFTPQTDAYSSLFFTITGFHYAHVTVGLLMLLVILLRNRAGHFNARRHLAVENTMLYWHFVGVVWLFVFTTFYITPHWWR